MSAVLRVTGSYQELNTALKTVSLEFSEAIASTKARERNDSSYEGRSTFNLTVSDADGDCVPQQVEECERFLSEHEIELVMIRKLSCVEVVSLDFMWSYPIDRLGQINRFPYSLLKLCVEFGIDLVISVYGISCGQDNP